MNWMSMMANPKVPAIKKMMFEFLKARYARNDQIVERIAVSALQTEGDMQAFVKLITDCYEEGYMRAVNDHKEQLAKAGLQARIVTPPQ
jgi:hypothetical protein